MAYPVKKDEIKELQEKISFSPKGAYLFWGEEEYLKHHYLGKLREIVEKEGMADFNVTVLDFLKSDTVNDLEEAVSSPPVMASTKLIEVWGLVLDEMKEDAQKKFFTCLKKLDGDTILVIISRQDELDLKVKKNAKLKGKLDDNLMTIEFPRQSEAKLLSWVDKIFSQHGVRISDKNITRMIKLCDFSMTRLKSESEKLIASCKFYSLDSVPDAYIPLFVKNTAENEVYDLENAIVRHDMKECLEIFENLRSQNIEPVQLSGVVGRCLYALAFLKSARGLDGAELLRGSGLKFDWQVKKYLSGVGYWSREELERALALVAECDKELKRISTPPYVLLEALFVRIFENGR